MVWLSLLSFVYQILRSLLIEVLEGHLMIHHLLYELAPDSEYSHLWFGRHVFVRFLWYQFISMHKYLPLNSPPPLACISGWTTLCNIWTFPLIHITCKNLQSHNKVRSLNYITCNSKIHKSCTVTSLNSESVFLPGGCSVLSQPE